MGGLDLPEVSHSALDFADFAVQIFELGCLLPEVTRDVLGELKRDVAELDKRLDGLRGHL